VIAEHSLAAGRLSAETGRPVDEVAPLVGDDQPGRKARTERAG